MIQKSKLIAQGQTAELFSIEGDSQRVLKLFRVQYESWIAELEIRNAQAAHKAGLYTPAVFDLVEVDGRSGIIYERVESMTFAQGALGKPWHLFKAADQFARLHTHIHQKYDSTLRPLVERLEHKINRAALLSPMQKSAAIESLKRLPTGDKFLHGDFHPENILMTSRGPIVIDWIDATCGNPLADVARTCILLQQPIETEILPISLLVRIFRAAYLRRYCALNNVTPEQIKAWMLPIAAGRLSEGIKVQESSLVKMVERLMNTNTHHG